MIQLPCEHHQKPCLPPCCRLGARIRIFALVALGMLASITVFLSSPKSTWSNSSVSAVAAGFLNSGQDVQQQLRKPAFSDEQPRQHVALQQMQRDLFQQQEFQQQQLQQQQRQEAHSALHDRMKQSAEFKPHSLPRSTEAPVQTSVSSEHAQQQSVPSQALATPKADAGAQLALEIQPAVVGRNSSHKSQQHRQQQQQQHHRQQHQRQPQQKQKKDGQHGPRPPQQQEPRPRPAPAPTSMAAQTAQAEGVQQSLPNSQLDASEVAKLAGKRIKHGGPPVAICMTGEPRTLHTPPVKTCMQRNLAAIEPYDVFVVFRGEGKHADLKHEASLVPIQPVVHLEFAPNFRASAIGCERQEELQHRCWQALQSQEAARQARYTWVVRLRPDLLILKALPALVQLEAMSPRPSILLPPFSEFYFDPADCMKFQGKSREEYDADYRQCSADQLHLSHHLMSDQFAIMPRSLAKAYLDREAPKWTYPVPNRPKTPPTSGAHLELWESCVLDKEYNYKIGPGFLGGCECSLSVAVRQMQNVSTMVAPFHVALYRGKGNVHMGGSFPKRALKWAFQEGE